ncbi:MAG: EAL domain-containing protein [Candidatus Dormibacteria bacterium]
MSARHVVLVAPPWYPVPPDGYGGIELVVGLLASALRAAGHRVTLLAAEGSAPGSIALGRRSWRADLGTPTERLRELTYATAVAGAIARLEAVDVVHDHCGFATLVAASATHVAPVLHTVHGAIPEAYAAFYTSLVERAGFAAISAAQRHSMPKLPWTGTVHNAVDVTALQFTPAEKEPYLLCLARICPDKGQHLAIEVARRAGMRLVLAGKVEAIPDATDYFTRHVAPFVDGDRVVHIDNVAGDAKARLLARAHAMLSPLQWDEPFGLAMVEAMASGTPVIAMARGAAPELVTEGITGFLVSDVEGMTEALSRLPEIDPMACAVATRSRFSADVMANAYLRLYDLVISGHPVSAGEPAASNSRPPTTTIAANGGSAPSMATEAFALTDDDDIVTYVSAAGLQLLGYTSAELVGKPVHRLVHPDDRAPGAWSGDGDGSDSGTRSLRYRRKDGSFAVVQSRRQAVGDSLSGVLREAQSLLEEIGYLKVAQANIERQALTDDLTGLANRTLLADRMRQAVLHLERSPGFVGVLMLDLDHFKAINDTLGHDAGDGVLIEAARRIEHLARPEDTVARFGGDEFVLVVEALSDPADLTAFADRIVAGLRVPYRVGADEVVVTVSVGIAVASQPDCVPADLLREADMAMYRAKSRGRDRHEVYGVALQLRATERLEVERLVRHALAADLLLVEYLPIVDIASGTTVGAEALLRVVGEDRTPFTAQHFLDVAEETGQLPLMDRRVRATGFADLTLWRASPACRDVERLAVNLTARELAGSDFVSELARNLTSAGLSGADLSIEVTEHVLKQTSHSALASLAELRELGIHIGLDDFGTGFSALSYLQMFPLDFVKIDRSFIQRIASDARSSSIVAAIIDLAHALDLYVIAEGVENTDQLDQLRLLGCDRAQGYLFSPALGCADFMERLVRATASPSPPRQSTASERVPRRGRGTAASAGQDDS